jgi:pyridoxine 5-phosphate synthase
MTKTLSVNVDHIATLREARKEFFPDPVQAAVLCELGGADGITVHLRTDRRHIQERDLLLLRQTIKGELNLEMAATEELRNIALGVKPDVVSIVPESPGEITTEGGLDLKANFAKIKPEADLLKKAGIQLSVFIEAEPEQIDAAKKLGADRIEINTNQYVKASSRRRELLAVIDRAGKCASQAGLLVHAGHGLDYKNIEGILVMPEIVGFSIGFSIVARALYVGLERAVAEMKRLIERSS